jgi:adenine-specific DNA glycosylase
LPKTRGQVTEPYIDSFFEDYPTVQSVRDAEPQTFLRHYFQPLGMHRRAWCDVDLARASLEDPPMSMVLRCKVGEFDSHLSEVAHLPGVGEYASDAWRFYFVLAFSLYTQIVVVTWNVNEQERQPIVSSLIKSLRSRPSRTLPVLLMLNPHNAMNFFVQKTMRYFPYNIYNTHDPKFCSSPCCCIIFISTHLCG